MEIIVLCFAIYGRYPSIKFIGLSRISRLKLDNISFFIDCKNIDTISRSNNKSFSWNKFAFIVFWTNIYKLVVPIIWISRTCYFPATFLIYINIKTWLLKPSGNNVVYWLLDSSYFFANIIVSIVWVWCKMNQIVFLIQAINVNVRTKVYCSCI